MIAMRISAEENPAAADLNVIERALIEHNEAIKSHAPQLQR
jgi:hypothetical protein